MINEDRVRELYRMAIYDEKHSDSDVAGQYYMWDYVGKELVKSSLTGSIAFILLVVLWGMSDLEALTTLINSLELTETIVRIVILYVGFLAIYLFATVLVYALRYTGKRRNLRRYAAHLRRVLKMYAREEKLKS